LLGLGANVNVKNQAGKTAIDLATNPQTIQLLESDMSTEELNQC
jgi:hypothetical protein